MLPDEMRVRYKVGYKYQLARDCIRRGTIKPEAPIDTDYIALDMDGMMRVKKSYAWDGCSGPTIDTVTNMRGGLFHDAYFQLMRLGLLPESCFEEANREFKRICLEDGMSKVRAALFFMGVSTSFSRACAKRGTEQKERIAP
jgi:hypothetical protein